MSFTFKIYNSLLDAIASLGVGVHSGLLKTWRHNTDTWSIQPLHGWQGHQRSLGIHWSPVLFMVSSSSMVSKALFVSRSSMVTTKGLQWSQGLYMSLDLEQWQGIYCLEVFNNFKVFNGITIICKIGSVTKWRMETKIDWSFALCTNLKYICSFHRLLKGIPKGKCT